MTLTDCPLGPVMKSSCTAPFLEMNKSFPVTRTQVDSGLEEMRRASAAMKRVSSEEMK